MQIKTTFLRCCEFRCSKAWTWVFLWQSTWRCCYRRVCVCDMLSSQLQLHTPGTHYRLTLDLVTLYTPLKNTSQHTCSDSLSLKPPEPLYPLQDFKALYKYCIIIIICSTEHWDVVTDTWQTLTTTVNSCRKSSHLRRVPDVIPNSLNVRGPFSTYSKPWWCREITQTVMQGNHVNNDGGKSRPTTHTLGNNQRL